MHTNNNKSPSKSQEPDVRSSLWEVIDTLLIIGAVAMTVLLIIAHFYVSEIDTREEGSTTNADVPPKAERIEIARSLALAVIGNSIPVFLLFVVSALLFRRLNKLRQSADRDDLAKELTQSIVGAIAHPCADKIFSHKTSEVELIDRAQSFALLIQETGSLIAETARSEILALIARGGEVQVVVTLPQAPISELMAFRNATLTSAKAILARSKRFEDHLDEFREAAQKGPGTIEIRYLSYPVGSTLTLIDCKTDDLKRACGVWRISGFKVPFERKLDVTLDYGSSPRVLRLLRDEAFQTFIHSSKCILLQGETRIGKTTLFRALCEQFQNVEKIFWVLSEPIWDAADKTKRLGFTVRTSDSQSVQFATRQASGSYTCKSEVWDRIADLLDKAVKAGKVIVLDEIGPLQLKSRKFALILDRIFATPSTHLIASIAIPSLLGDVPTVQYWHHPRSTHLHLKNETNKQQMLSRLEFEVKASCSVPAFVS